MNPHPKVFLGFDYYVPGIHRGVVRAARRLGWDLRTNAHDRTTPAGSRFDGAILQYGVDGALDALAHAHPGRVVDFTRFSDDAGLPRVTTDPTAAGTLAAAFLTDQGHRDLAVVEGRHWGDPARRRAFLETASAGGARCAVWNIRECARTSPDTKADGDALAVWFRSKLEATHGPVAVFCMHDEHAEILLRAARDAGIAVPGRLAVLGCDNDTLVCESARPPLSSIDPNFEVVGYEAAMLLDALMRGEPAPDAPTGVPPAGVVERASTGALRDGSPTVRAALKRIELAGDDVEPDVDALARAAGVNRRALERAFRESQGVSPLRFLIRRRVERAANLMRADPAMSGPIVAERLGYRSLPHFYRQFFSVKGVSVDEFRRHDTHRGIGRRGPKNTFGDRPA